MESRPYRGEDDYGRLLAFLRELFAVAGPSVPMTVGDLEFWRYQTESPETEMDSCRIWFAGNGQVAGFAWPGEGVNDMVVHPEHAALADPMLAWGETVVTGDVTVSAREHDSKLQQVLRARGYEPEHDWMHWYRVRPLNEPVEDPAVAVRSVQDSDIAGLVTLRKERVIPLESYRTLRARAIVYRADLDLVTVASDGSVAAFATVWYDECNRTGLFEPVGCHPAHRRRGLASAVMREGMRRLQRLGARQALVGCGGSNTAANALYASLGFASGGRSRNWRKTARS